LDNLQITPVVYPSYNNSTENKNCNGSANSNTLSSSEKAMNALVNTMPLPPEVWSNGEVRVKVKHPHSATVSAGVGVGAARNNRNGNPGTLAANLTPQPIFSVGTKPLPSAGNSSPRLAPNHPGQGIIRSTSSGSLGSMGRHHYPGSLVRNGSFVVTGLGGAVSSHTTNMRRQRRLERNRESARLSRRRRKQYLEVLEEKVATLSEMMDNGRRQHAAISVPTINALRERQFAIAEKDLTEYSNTSTKIPRMEGHLRILGGPFSRMSDELKIATEFQREQLRCVCLPQHSKFIQWLTLQNDCYFRGGRSASERLSAARIGEKFLASGNGRVPPSNGMWPLFCHEVGLSYDQEEKFRNLQRTILTNRNSWLDRRAAQASHSAIYAFGQTLLGASEKVRNNKNNIFNILTIEQRLKYLIWAKKNKERIKQTFAFNEYEKPTTAIQPGKHDVAKVIGLAQKMEEAHQLFPDIASLIPHLALRKLSRRPSYESLGSQTKEQLGIAQSNSTGSLSSMKRSGSGGSLPGRERSSSISSLNQGSTSGTSLLPLISPEEAQAAAKASIMSALGMNAFGDTSTSEEEGKAGLTSETISMEMDIDPLPVKGGEIDPVDINLTAINEENAVDDILLNLVDDDWAIGFDIDG